MKTGTRLLRALLFGLGACFALIGLLLFFAWLLFPRELVRQLPEKVLNTALPGWQWQIGGFFYEPPLALRLEQVEGRASSTVYGKLYGKTSEPIQLESLVLRPDPLAFFQQRELRGHFTLHMAQGTMTGNSLVRFDEGQRSIDLSATLDSLNLVELGWLRQGLDRQVQGILSGTVQARIVQGGVLENLHAAVHVADGELPLRRSIQGHERLPFTSLLLRLEQDGQNIAVENGSLQSPLCTCDFQGVVQFIQPLLANLTSSRLDVRGTVHPKPALYAQLRSEQEVQMIEAYREHPARDAFHVVLSGSLADPALAFERDERDAALLQAPEQERGTGP
ncbi:MAG: type II secretion system protein GspN [Desulfobulbus sp.]|jgi:type II secretion system protein N